MRKLKEVLRLHSLGMSQHQIARSCERLSPAARCVVEEGGFVVICVSLWEMIQKTGRPPL